MHLLIALLVIAFGYHSAVLSADIQLASSQRLSSVDQVNADFLDLFSRQIHYVSKSLDLPLSTDSMRMSDLMSEFSPRSRDVFLNVAKTGTPAGMSFETKALEIQADLLKEWQDMTSMDKRDTRAVQRRLMSRDFMPSQIVKEAAWYSPFLHNSLHERMSEFDHGLRVFFKEHWPESEERIAKIIRQTLARLEQEKAALNREERTQGLILDAARKRAHQIIDGVMQGHLVLEVPAGSALDPPVEMPRIEPPQETDLKKENSLRRMLVTLIRSLKQRNLPEPEPFSTPPIFHGGELEKIVTPSPMDPAVQAQLVAAKGFMRKPMVKKTLIHVKKNAKVLCGGWVLKLGLTLVFLAVSAATLSSGEILQGSE